MNKLAEGIALKKGPPAKARRAMKKSHRAGDHWIMAKKNVRGAKQRKTTPALEFDQEEIQLINSVARAAAKSLAK